MANTILHKRSSTALAVPSAGVMTAGEIAINTTDEKLYIKNTGGSVVEVGGGAGGIANVVEDLSPQLGAALDTNGFRIHSNGGSTFGARLDVSDTNLLVQGSYGSGGATGGGVQIFSGQSAAGSSGSINILSANAPAAGGNVTVQAGSGGSSAGGDMTITAGLSTSSVGGTVAITAGSGTGPGGAAKGGDVSITAGVSGTSGNAGGSITLTPGAGGSGADGTVDIQGDMEVTGNLSASNTTAGAPIEGTNDDTGAYSAGIKGICSAVGGFGAGVLGETSSGGQIGVMGRGISASGNDIGVFGETTSSGTSAWGGLFQNTDGVDTALYAAGKTTLLQGTYGGSEVMAVTETGDANFNGNVVSHIDINAQTGTAYTAVLADDGVMITMNNAAANTLTIPANASVNYKIGTQILVTQLGAGTTSFAITTDTLVSAGGLTDLAGQYSSATLIKIASTTWLLAGDLA